MYHACVMCIYYEMNNQYQYPMTFIAVNPLITITFINHNKIKAPFDSIVILLHIYTTCVYVAHVQIYIYMLYAWFMHKKSQYVQCMCRQYIVCIREKMYTMSTHRP